MVSRYEKADFTPEEVKSLGLAMDEAERHLKKMRPVTSGIDASCLRNELARAVIRLAKAGETEPFFLSRVAVGHVLLATRQGFAESRAC
ncbi:hypothetical protein [Prosthecomicrobium sp. N25]|uniref:hypothetical protein n=1 Tax=Prosthecomicrobium sp. N25 TaxID=3129254 RepID=UPI0030786836